MNWLWIGKIRVKFGKKLSFWYIAYSVRDSCKHFWKIYVGVKCFLFPFCLICHYIYLSEVLGCFVFDQAIGLSLTVSLVIFNFSNNALRKIPASCTYTLLSVVNNTFTCEILWLCETWDMTKIIWHIWWHNNIFRVFWIDVPRC